MSQTEISDEELVERDDGYTEEAYNYTEQRELQEADDVLQNDDGGGDDNNTQYLKADPHGRTERNTHLLQVKQGLEPAHFTSHFHGWNKSKLKRRYERQITSEADDVVTQNDIPNQNNVTEVREELERYDRTYPYKELIKKRPPSGVDVTCKEKYLSDDEFVEVFGITKEEFYSLPKWRQVNQKKKAELF